MVWSFDPWFSGARRSFHSGPEAQERAYITAWTLGLFLGCMAIVIVGLSTALFVPWPLLCIILVILVISYITLLLGKGPPKPISSNSIATYSTNENEVVSASCDSCVCFSCLSLRGTDGPAPPWHVLPSLARASSFAVGSHVGRWWH